MNQKKSHYQIFIAILSLAVLLPFIIGCTRKVENQYKNNILLIKLPGKQSTHGNKIKTEKIKKGTKSNLCLASDILAADILVDKKDSKTVLLAAKLFSEDVERITGHKAEVKDQPLQKFC